MGADEGGGARSTDGGGGGNGGKGTGGGRSSEVVEEAALEAGREGDGRMGEAHSLEADAAARADVSAAAADGPSVAAAMSSAPGEGTVDAADGVSTSAPPPQREGNS